MAITCSVKSGMLNDFLKADPFDQQLFLKVGQNGHTDPVMDKAGFFENIYVPVKDNCITVSDGSQIEKRNYSLDSWLDGLGQIDNSIVLFIEGYAGCGKSVFVQYILQNQLRSLDYDRNYFNYDIGSYYDSSKTQRIASAIMACFCEQLAKCVVNNEQETIDVLFSLLQKESLRYVDPSYQIATLTCVDAVESAIEILKNTKNVNTFRLSLQRQYDGLFCEHILALDCIFRIAKYLTAPDEASRQLYVCYDNLDSIENFDDLRLFDKTLVSLRRNIDNYLMQIKEEFDTRHIPIPQFIFMATYRKITAARVELAVHSERGDDYGAENRFLYYIDASHLFEYRQMIENRYRYFEKLFHLKGIAKEGAPILEKMALAEKLFHLSFVGGRYSGLWNNNYRTCSDILKKLIKDYESELMQCYALMEERKCDGYDYSNFGASAVFLNLICHVFRKNRLWDSDHLNLVAIQRAAEDAQNTKLTSLSRLILTFMANNIDSNRNQLPVSTREIFDEFCDLFSPEEVCECLANMLARDVSGTWRRPIYYHRNALNDGENIKDRFLQQWREYRDPSLTVGSNCRVTELLLCDCGLTYIERVALEFEFFSVRLGSGYTKSIYLLDDISEIKSVIERVYSAVENCCSNLSIFGKHYMSAKGIGVDEYVERKIHPLTKKARPQLHSERIIFCHIAYLNHCRLYHVQKLNVHEEKVAVNQVFIDAIDKYIGLYNTYIKPVTEARASIMEDLTNVLDTIKENPDDEIAFTASIRSSKGANLPNAEST